MKQLMNQPMRQLVLTCALFAAGSAQAWDCEHRRDIDLTMDVANSSQLSVVAGAGELEILGQGDSSNTRVRGKVCASDPELLHQAEVITEGGSSAAVYVSLPDTDDGWFFKRNEYVYVDLSIEVPSNLVLDVRDSSGDISIGGTGAVRLSDSSGDIELENIHGAVALDDSSGDIDLSGIEGDVTVHQDSSGDIYGSDIQGSVLVERDSSGDIRFRNVRDNFIVERDSSGDIVGNTVGGDFRVDRDSSGSIKTSDVSGSIEIPKNKR